MPPGAGQARSSDRARAGIRFVRHLPEQSSHLHPGWRSPPSSQLSSSVQGLQKKSAGRYRCCVLQGSGSPAPPRTETDGGKYPGWQQLRTLEASGNPVRSLAKRLVGPEAHDGQSEGIHGQLTVPDCLAKDVGNAGCPSLPLEFRMIRWIRIDLFEFYSR